jgi:hypothetical protein
MIIVLLWPMAVLANDWDTVIRDPSRRFVAIAGFGYSAVVDRETGLVWERAPQTTGHPWADARYQCANKAVGGRKGWRLPSIVEFSSLVDTSETYNPSLPPRHPFLNIQQGTYWSGTNMAGDAAMAWAQWSNGGVGGMEKSLAFGLVWCVRAR